MDKQKRQPIAESEMIQPEGEASTAVSTQQTAQATRADGELMQEVDITLFSLELMQQIPFPLLEKSKMCDAAYHYIPPSPWQTNLA